MDQLFKTARILFVDTNREWETPYPMLAEYDQLMISVNTLEAKRWPSGGRAGPKQALWNAYYIYLLFWAHPSWQTLTCPGP